MCGDLPSTTKLIRNELRQYNWPYPQLVSTSLTKNEKKKDFNQLIIDYNLSF